MKHIVRCVAALSIIFLAKCSAPSQPTQAEVGRLTLAASILADQCGITKASIEVAADDFPSPVGPLALAVNGTEITGHVDNVPAGTQRKVTVKAINQDNQTVYEGASFVDVQANKVADVPLTLYRNFANCPFQGVRPTPERGSVAVKGSLNNDFLAFSFSAADIASSGVVYMVDDKNHLVRSYDIQAEAFGESFSVPNDVSATAVSPDGANIYVAYGQGRMDKITTATRERVFFTAGPARISSMAVVGDYVFTIDGSGAWNTETLYDRKSGRRTSSADWRNASQSIVYAPSLNKVYTLSDGVSPADIHATTVDLTTGKIGTDADSPYHGDYALRHPLRLFPDGSKIASGSGIVFNTSDLTYLESMGMPYVDLAFQGDRMYLLQQASPDSELVVLDRQYAVVDRVALEGTPLRVFAHGNALVAITQTTSGLRLRRL